MSDKFSNRKMTRSFPVPASFFLGAKVLKRFSGKWYADTVTDMDADEGEVLWGMVYEDFDSEQVSRKDMASTLIPPLVKDLCRHKHVRSRLICMVFSGTTTSIEESSGGGHH